MKNSSVQHHQNSGFTLVEVLIALAVSGIIFSMVFVSFKSQQDSYLAQDQVVEMQQNIRAGVESMVQEIRMAGYDPYCSGNIGIETADSESISFTLIADDDGKDNDNDGSTDETGEIKEITFDFYDAYGDGDKDIGRQEGEDAKAAIAENFEALEFYYLDADGNSTSNIDKIESIQISVLARSDQPDNHSNQSNSSTYTSASGVIWGPYNDNYKRRFQIITVHLRNMDT